MNRIAAAATSASSPVLYEDSAYEEGLRAFSAGALMSACPYPQRSAQREAWESGWFDFARAVEMLPDD